MLLMLNYTFYKFYFFYSVICFLTIFSTNTTEIIACFFLTKTPLQNKTISLIHGMLILPYLKHTADVFY